MLKKQWPTSQERERLSVCRLYTRRLCSDSAQRTSTQASACASAHPFAQARPVQSLSGEQVGSSAACHLYHVDYDHAPVAQSLGASVPLRATRRYHASDEVSSHRLGSAPSTTCECQGRSCVRASASAVHSRKRVMLQGGLSRASAFGRATAQAHVATPPIPPPSSARSSGLGAVVWPRPCIRPREARTGTPLTRSGLL